MSLARSLLFLIGTLVVVAALWMTLLSGGGRTPALTPSGTTAQSGASATSGLKSAVDAAGSAVQQSNQDAQRAAGAAPVTP